MSNVLELKQIKRHFGVGETKVCVLKGVNFALKAGEVVALLGPSGSGKSTLLQIAGLLDSPNSGSVWVNGQEINTKNDAIRTQVRQRTMGFVYQSHLLLNDFSALENVMLPMLIAGQNQTAARERALILLDRMGLKKRAQHRPGQLSGGEQQRVAIARALANEPKILLADEPTGNLDPQTAESVFKTLLNVVAETGLAALIATHNPELAQKMHRRVTVQDGLLMNLK